MELADTGDLKSPGRLRPCGFESRPGYYLAMRSRIRSESAVENDGLWFRSVGLGAYFTNVLCFSIQSPMC